MRLSYLELFQKFFDIKAKDFTGKLTVFSRNFATMSEELNKILLKRTLKNKKIIKPLVLISLTVGCNLRRITGFRDPIKL